MHALLVRTSCSTNNGAAAASSQRAARPALRQPRAAGIVAADNGAQFSVPPPAFVGVSLYYVAWGVAVLAQPAACLSLLVAPGIPVGPVTLLVTQVLFALNFVVAPSLLALAKPAQLTARAAGRLTAALLIAGAADVGTNYALVAQGLTPIPLATALALSSPLLLVAGASAYARGGLGPGLAPAAKGLAWDALTPDATNAPSALFSGMAALAALAGVAQIIAPGVMHSLVTPRAPTAFLLHLWRLQGAYLIAAAAVAVTLREAAANRALGGAVYRALAAGTATFGAAVLAASWGPAAAGVLTPAAAAFHLGAGGLSLVGGVLGMTGKYVL